MRLSVGQPQCGPCCCGKRKKQLAKPLGTPTVLTKRAAGATKRRVLTVAVAVGGGGFDREQGLHI